MVSFDYCNPVQLIFGEGTFNRLGEGPAPGEGHALLVTGRSAARRLGYLDRAVTMLRDRGLQVTVYDAVPSNPTDSIVDAGATLAREAGCDLVVGLGGGSAMDAAKAIAVAAYHDLPVRAFLVPDERGTVRVPTDRTLPIICVTTTSGTSSETTPYAVITLEDSRDKTAIRDRRVYPRVAICDPELTYHVSPRTTAATGVDVLSHAVEAFTALGAGPFTDQASAEAIRLVGLYLPRAVAAGTDKEARHYMSLANVFAGVGLSNCGVSMPHALEHPVSGHYPEVAHGEGLAALLVPFASACWEAQPEKFARVSSLLDGPHDASAAAQTIKAFLGRVDLDIKLSHLGVERDMLPHLADDALRYMAGAVDRTPGSPTRERLIEALEASW